MNVLKYRTNPVCKLTYSKYPLGYYYQIFTIIMSLVLVYSCIKINVSEVLICIMYLGTIFL